MSGTDATKKLCGVCKANEVFGRQRVCDACKSEKPVAQAENQAMCPDCGDMLDSRINHNGLKMCCWLKKMKVARENKSKNTSPGLKLVIDFSMYPDLLEDIKQEAEEELRTPENQALWRLIKLTIRDRIKANQE